VKLPEYWEQLGDLFAQLHATAPEQRESFLNTACGTDLKLRAELRSLWDSHASSGPLDAAPEFLISDEDINEPRELPGMQVGPYRLLRHIGEGGMGSVWLAERFDGVVKRAIALKRPHVSWIGALAQHAEQERDILSGLEHPNIARLYDAGITDSGEPYLALEFIDGVPITRFCDQKQLSTRRRLGLILQVLEAVHFAHSRLVIHRDIKPSNILVSAEGRVHLLDFGIAKLLNRDYSDSGAEAALPLTPDYASPEQIRGEAIGTASDVYSLGIVSYEILTGARPYRLHSRGAARLAAELTLVNIQPASTVATATARRELRGDLDAILAKALHAAPERRYATVDAFASDIERHLNSQPVSARRDHFAYRLSKFVTRNRWQAASIVLASIALLAGTAVAFWQAHVARAQAARAEQVKSFALSILESADTDSGAGAATTAVQLLQTARLRVEHELSGRPTMAAELMSAIGYGLLGQDRTDDAADVLKKAVDLSIQANGASDIRTAAAQVIYAEALYDQGHSAQAIALLEPAAKLAHHSHDSHVEVDALRWLSSAKIDTGDYNDGIALARAAVAALPRPMPTGRRARQDAIQAHLCLANALNAAELPGVVDETRAALRLMAQLEGVQGSAHWWAARGYLGTGLVREGQVAAGLQELRQAYEGANALLGANHEGTEINATYWGKALLDAGEIQQSIAAFQLAFDAVVRRDSGRESTALAYEHLGLASALAAAPEWRESISHYAAAARLFASDGGEGSPLAVRARIGEANALIQLGQLQAADRELDALSKLPLGGVDKTWFQVRLAQLRAIQGRRDEALRLVELASVNTPALPKPRRAQAWSSLGMSLLAANRPLQAAAMLDRADALFREVEITASPARIENGRALQRARSVPVPATSAARR
jgi:eukaryotic-like serine/threonine-protein kinase